MKKRVLVWLSGWVDSAVSALLLQQQGWEVTWWFMINYKDPTNPNCTTRIDLQAAKEVAEFLGIELLKFDFVKEYEERILNYIFEWYQKGITPNPDVFCNNLVKFDLFLKEAIKLWFDKIAMWHYARIYSTPSSWAKSDFSSDEVERSLHKSDNEIFNTGFLPSQEWQKKWQQKTSKKAFFQLLQWKDKNKDQSYFLSGLNEYQLSKSLFPLWKLTKPEVRNLAIKHNLPNANRPDSQGLCFVWKVSMKDFLATKISPKKGKILTTMWVEVGEHDGAWAWTIGQKRWLNINKPAYVVETNIEENTVIISYDKNDPKLLKNEVICLDWHWVNEKKTLKKGFFCKLRYRQEKQTCSFVYNKKENIMKIILNKPVWWVAKWQIAVLYEWEIVLWNWVIW